AVAEALAAEGCNVHLVARSKDALEAGAQRIRDRYQVSVGVHALDLSDSTNIKTLLDTAGLPDILVNNAGAIPGGNLEKIVEDTWREAWDLKVFGYINLCRACYGAMRDRGHGVIINVTGLAAERFDFNYIAGTTGNAGLNAFTRALGSFSLEDNIRVMAVCPGAVLTERLETLMKTRAEAELGDASRWQELLANLPTGRAATVEEVANVVLFLASDKASWMTGTVVTVDGGHGARGGSFR
ncbi:MAG: SDR family oxidoreductase, partial [Gammaproteobacteria bacterium]|nr:SDR family oxidoreductase [Gammaproteobacteria bacterium]